MATGPVANQGKTAFLEEFLAENRDAKLEEVNRAWSASGNVGTISESLLGKIRARLGLTGRRAASEPAEEASGAPRSRSRSKRPTPGRTAGSSDWSRPRAVETASRRAEGIDISAEGGATTQGGDQEDVLDDLEEGIDELIQKIRELGGRPDVVKALRRARRLLVRGHEV